MDKVFVSQGQRVSAGCVIGLLGETGGNAEAARSANAHMGPDLAHLHYEIVYNGSATSVTAPNGREIAIQRGVSNCYCGSFKQKIKPNDFMTYYE
jgi:murein DD-endopeptidase MepM/ murein hydrolase activator NlpD